MSDDEDDPIIGEVDVYLSQRLASSLYIYQYPVRPATMTYDNVHMISAKMKPTQQKVELEMAINTTSANFCQSKGEMIAQNVDGSVPEIYNSGVMDKQLLTSTPPIVDHRRYAVGTLSGGELHMTPVNGLVQLRPSFTYMDTADAKAKGDMEPVGVPEEEQDIKAVTVRFARRETEDAKNRRMASFEYMSRRSEEERWVSLRHHNVDSADAETERAKLTAHHLENVSEWHTTSGDYLTRLMPATEEEKETAVPMPNNVLSLADLKNLSLADQIRALMLNAKLLRFTQLISLLPQGTDPTSALRCLQQVAMLVQGCWVVKSEVLYPKDTLSALSGVPAETLARGRDYVLWRFTRSRCVVRKDIASVVRLPAEDVREMLEQVARLRLASGWEFCLPPDADFLTRHQEVATRQNMLWDAKFTQLCQSLRISAADMERKALPDDVLLASPDRTTRRRRTSSTRSKHKSGSGLSDSSDNEDSVQRKRSNSLVGESPAERRRRESGASDKSKEQLRNVSGGNATPQRRRNTDMSPESELLKKRDKVLLDTGLATELIAAVGLNSDKEDIDASNGMSMEVTSDGGGDNNSTKTKRKVLKASDNSNVRHWEGGDSADEDISIKTEHVSPKPVVFSVPTISSGAQLQKELCSFLREKLSSRFVLTLPDVRSLIALHLAQAAPGHILSTGVSDKLLHTSLVAVGGKMLPICDKPTYALAAIGDRLDNIRAALVDIVSQHKTFKSTLLKRKLEEIDGEAPSDVDVKKVLREYCVTKGSQWHLKTIKES